MLTTLLPHASVLNPEDLLTSWGEAALWISVLVVFAECGLFIFFMPGDSLLFTIGMLVGTGVIGYPLWLVCVLLGLAAFLGNAVGYEIGRAIGPKLFDRPDSKIFKREYVEKTEAFFEKYGNRAIVLARFVPIVRTFITVTAGVGRMDRRRFLTYTGIGALLWAVGVTLLGHWLGAIPLVRDNIEIMLVLIVFVSLIPMIFEWWGAVRARKAAPEA